MKLIQISDTHGLHRKLRNLPNGDVIVHCGDFTNSGTEQEVLDFLNWFIDLPYGHKIFVVGNHDMCLYDAEGIEDLPKGVHFLQDCGCEIDDVHFFGLGYDHDPSFIPNDTDILITHEPPVMILDESSGIHWGNSLLRKKVLEVRPRYHLFGHAHNSNGMVKDSDIMFSNGSILDDKLKINYKPRLFKINS